MLVFLRLLQGISAGGEIASVTTYIIEVGNPRGWNFKEIVEFSVANSG